MAARQARERSWLEGAISGIGVLSAFVTIGLLFSDDTKWIMGIALGAGWTFAIAFYVTMSTYKLQISKLETRLEEETSKLKIEIAEERRRADEFSSTASNVASAVTTLMTALPGSQQNPPARRNPRGGAK